ncbi:MAG: hypothetical protein KFF68_04295 [Desulfosarcina sp.]|nr:hypothetical protein [Desulfosarcina sp.]
MKRILIVALLLLFAGPRDLFAERSHRSRQETHHRFGIRADTQPQSQDIRSRYKRSRLPAHDLRSRFRPPSRRPLHPGSPGKLVHPGYPVYHPGRPGHGRPGYWWPAGTTIVREIQPIIILNHPPPAAPAPPPEPEKVWVPPVMDTRTEPGYWDYGVKKVWMGNHWRYEQNHDERIWVPASRVKYVKQEGYWKPVE